MYKIVFFIIVVCFGAEVKAQCDLALDATIFSGDVNTYEIAVNGLVNNQLGLDQGLCGVQIAFNHTSITNLRIILTSPNGESVFLTGPASTQNTISAFINWDVTFIPCSSPASPDVDIPANWSNTAGWISVVDYSGSYYPNGGCLEDFNSGSANGVWTITIEDLGENTVGNLISVELIFCEPAGLECNICDAQLYNYEYQSLFFCQGQEQTLLVDDLVNNGNSQIYENYLVLTQNNSIIQTSDIAIEISTLGSGMYELYGLVANQNPNQFGLLNELIEGISNGEFCGEYSLVPIDINIAPIQAEVEITEDLCPDENYIFQNTLLEAPLDTLIYKNSQIGCDSVYHIVLNPLDVIAEIETVFGLLQPCDELILSASNLTVSQTGASYQWYTFDGSIASGENGPFCTIDQPGEYFLEVTLLGCTIVSSVMIDGIPGGPVLEIELDQTDCIEGIFSLNINTTVNFSDYQWYYNGSPIEEELNPTLVNLGNYTIELLGDDIPCEFPTASIEVFPVDIPEITLTKSGDLSCEIQSSDLIINALSHDVISIQWLLNQAVIAENTNGIAVSAGGVYTAQIQLANGCILNEQIEVLDFEVYFDSEVLLDSLNCSTQQGNVSVNSTGVIVSYEWSGPFGFYSIDPSPTVTDFGSYRVDIVYDNGCEQRLFVEVDYDDESPAIELDAQAIDCNNASGILFVTEGHQSDYTYNWAGPGGFESSFLQPEVFAPGNYFVTVTNAAGCEAYYFQFVPIDTTTAQFDITAQTLTCADIETILQPNFDGNGVDVFQWTGPSISSSNAMVYNTAVSLPGEYSISGLTTNGCPFSETVIVDIDTISPVISGLPDQILTCPNQVITLTPAVSDDVIGYSWSELFEFAPSLDVIEPGDYSLTVVAANGCQDVEVFTVGIVDQFPQLVIDTDTVTIGCSADPVPIFLNVINGEVFQGDFEWTITDPSDNLVPLMNDSNGGLFFEVDQPGNYNVSIDADNGCQLLSEVVVLSTTQVVFPEVSDVFFDCLITSGEVMLTNAQEFQFYEWDLTTQTSTDNGISLALDQDVSLNVIDWNGCDTTILIQPEVDTLTPIIDLSIVSAGDCFDPSSQLAAVVQNTSDVMYNWFTINGGFASNVNEDQVSVNQEGTYFCVVTDLSSSCSTIDSIVLDNTIPAIDIQFDIIQPDCSEQFGEIQNIVASMDGDITQITSIYLNEEEIGVNSEIQLNQGLQALTFITEEGCELDTIIDILIPEEVLATVESQYIINQGDSVLIEAILESDMPIDSFTFSWFENMSETGSAVYYPEQSFVGQLVIEYGLVCSILLPFEVIVNERSLVFLNNIVYQGSGTDGQFTVNTHPNVRTLDKLAIYDRWGNLIVDESSLQSGFTWDGTYNGTFVEQGVYVGYLELTTQADKQIRKVFDITVLR